MHPKYVELFKEIAHTTEVLAEQVMEYDRTKSDADGEKTAETMRNDFGAIYNKMSAKDFLPDSLTKSEFIRLMVGTLIVINNIENRITNERKAIDNYKAEILPKLERVINECENDEAAVTLANDLFSIKEN